MYDMSLDLDMKEQILELAKAKELLREREQELTNVIKEKDVQLNEKDEENRILKMRIAELEAAQKA